LNYLSSTILSCKDKGIQKSELICNNNSVFIYIYHFVRLIHVLILLTIQHFTVMILILFFFLSFFPIILSFLSFSDFYYLINHSLYFLVCSLIFYLPCPLFTAFILLYLLKLKNSRMQNVPQPLAFPSIYKYLRSKL